MAIRLSPLLKQTVTPSTVSSGNTGSFLSTMNAAFQQVDLSSLSSSEKEYLSWGNPDWSEVEKKRLVYGYRQGRRDLKAPEPARQEITPLSISPVTPPELPALPDLAEIQSKAESLIANPGVDLELEKLNLKAKRRASARGFAGSILSNPLGIQTGGFKPQTLLTSGGM